MTFVRSSVVALLAFLVLASNGAAQAQGRGFMFKRPVGSLTLRGGFAVPYAHSDIFSFTMSQLTVDRSDLTTLAADADLAMWLTPSVDVVLSSAYSGRNNQSEFRGWLDNNNGPIEQRTLFERVPVTLNLKVYLKPRGREIGRFAWLPTRLDAYAGAGAGVMWYRFRQTGDFIDFATLKVFNDRYESTGATLMGQALAGAEMSLSPLFFLNTEVRYGFARSGMSNDFVGFQKIDLAGFSATVGAGFRFPRWP
ncbi:MAG: hypothetical protein EXR93_02830 [Gemmatimonadetes bacterium]|nr:hypothetical protein [Gemmatimonadota bacterium]